MQDIEQCLGGGSPAGGNDPSSNPQCSSVNASIEACKTLTPSFTFLAPSAQATCLCYDNQGNFVPDAFDQAVSGCYQWAEASNSAYAVVVSSVNVLGFCTNHAAEASSGALPTSRMTSETFASNFVASSSAIITSFSSISSKGATTESRVEGAGGGTQSPLTSTSTPATATNNPSPTTSTTHSSGVGLWINPASFSAVAILLAMLALTLL